MNNVKINVKINNVWRSQKFTLRLGTGRMSEWSGLAAASRALKSFSSAATTSAVAMIAPESPASFRA